MVDAAGGDGKGDANTIVRKVVLIGNSSVGKTSIFNRIISDSYYEDGMSTYSAVFRSKTMEFPGNPTKIKVNLWDTAGQEKFFSLTKLYLQEAQGVILVYDTTYEESLDGCKIWYNMLKEHIDPKELVIALVGNKSDNVDNVQVSVKSAE